MRIILFLTTIFLFCSCYRKELILRVTDQNSEKTLKNATAYTFLREHKSDGNGFIVIKNLRKNAAIRLKAPDYNNTLFRPNGIPTEIDTLDVNMDLVMELRVKRDKIRDSLREVQWKIIDSTYNQRFSEVVLSTVTTDSIKSTAEFPGGKSALSSFLSRNLFYPEAAIQEGFQGKVYLKFIIEQDGQITNVKIAKGVETSLDREAIRVVRIMPKWTPAKINGEPVRSYYSLPIIFYLQ